MGTRENPPRRSGELLQLMREAVPVMRELGVASASFGELTLHLGAPPHYPETVKREKEDPHRERREHYTMLLGRRPTDKELEDLP